MNNSPHPFTTVTFEDGSIAVARTDPRKPRLLEVIAIFFDTARVRAYADRESRRAEPATEPADPPAQRSLQPTAPEPGLSPRQSAVMEALRARLDEHRQIAAKAATLAQAAQIPLGSLHSILQALEKKQLIRAVRAGSVRAPAVYEIL